MINRNTPSAQAATARNKLFELLLNDHSQEDLGIAKFPAEKSIYRAVLKASTIHRVIDGKWCLAAPNESDPCNFKHVWKVLEEFLDKTQNGPRPFSELDDVLRSAPFGIKDGVLPLLYAIAYTMHKDKIALYEEGKYIPFLPPERYPVFIKRPDLFSVQRVQLDATKTTLFNSYAKALLNKDSVTDIMDITKPIAKFMTSLPAYTKKSRTLNINARRVRKAFENAASPHDLFLHDLPTACGYSSAEFDHREFTEQLKLALTELSEAYPKMLNTQQANMCKALGFSTKNTFTSTLRENIQQRFRGFEDFTADEFGLKQFIQLLTDPQSSDRKWIEKILGFLSKKPTSNWLAADVDKSNYEIKKVCNQLLELESFVLMEGNTTSETSCLIKMIRKGTPERQQLIFLDDTAQSKVDSVADTLYNQLLDLKDEQLKLAALAKLTEKLLPEVNSK